jgi:hypothetical protein
MSLVVSRIILLEMKKMRLARIAFTITVLAGLTFTLILKPGQSVSRRCLRNPIPAAPLAYFAVLKSSP